MAKRHTESIALSKFGALVAQLESIVASASQQTPDPLLCLDLLSELLSSIEEESQEGIVQWQRKCEDALYSLLVLGARRPIRRLASSAMVRVIAKGDAISIYSRASSLQGWLADSKRSEPLSCAGVAQCLGELYHYFGRRITSGLTETANIATKLLKFHEDFVRQDALRMLNSALEGSGPGGPSAAYSEFFRIIMRLGVNDKAFNVRYAAARCLKTFASIGGPGVGTTELESSMSHCVKALEDPVSSVRDAFAEALGALLAFARNPIAQVNKRGKDHSVPAKKLEDSLQKYLLSPFTRATGVRAKDLRIGLTLSWVSFLQLIHLKYHLPYEEFQNFAILAIDMLQASSSRDTHALACVLYILRVGAADQMTESNQRSFLVHLARKLDSEAFDPFFGVATLRILSYLLTTLGEVPSEFKDIMDDTVFAALSHSSLHVRIAAALTLRALAEVDTNSVGGLISYCVTTLYALRESAANGKGDNLKNELFSLHGQAAVVAALTSISPRLPLGYPSRMPKLVLDVSKKMLTEFSWNPTAATVEMDAGWLLLAALVASMPKEELADQIFDILLLWADPFVGGSHSRTRKAQDFISELWVLSAAIEALVAFIRSFVSSPTAGTNGIFLHPVLAYLRGALSHLSTFIAMNLPNLRSAIDLFTIRILMAFQSLSDPMTYKSEHPQILQICMTPFCDPSFGEESSCLKFLLDKRDACLGPWIPGRDSFEDELRSFDGGEDGIMPCVWEELISFPQPFSLSKMLVNQMLLCLGAIFSCQDDSGKALILSKIDHCLKAGKKQFCHLSSITNACVALLAGLKAMLGVRVESCGPEILSTLQSIFMGILAENEITSAQRRACAEGLGLLARLGSDSFTAWMAKNLLGELVSATDSYYIGSAALSLGCIHRSVGGMALSSLVPATVASLSSIAKSSNSTLQLWSLHALLLTIEASGLSFVSQVQATLFLVMEILLCEENGLVELRQEIGCIVNAIVAVLGPEIAPRSTFFSRCKSVITEISSCQEISALLESVRFTQQLVLFAPHAVSIHTHVQSLLPTLSSRQPSLRYLAVSTLRHLIEKYPNMAEEKIEEELFRMLDEETDSEIGNLVRSTINRLLYASCPICPSRWLSLLRKMVLSASTMNNAENGTSIENELIVGGSVGGSKLYFGQDDEDMIGSSSGESLQDFNFVNKRNNHLRYRTRLFAAECLSHLPEAVGANPMHFDLSLANSQHGNGSSSPDWLVFHLQEIISLSYQISTGKFVGLQSIGVELLSTILEKFGKTQDPDLPGHLLLEQYQAQFVSAVRSAIGTSSGPLLLEAGLLLATKVLTSSILCGDRVAVRQMFSLISKPLDEIKDLCYPSYAEWVTCKIKVRLLAAHASIKRFLYQFLRKEDNIPDEYLQLASLLSNSSIILGKYWISILKDYVFISSGLNSKPNYKPFLDGIQSPLVSSKVRACLAEAWPLIMEATSLDAVPLMLEVDHASEVSSMAAFQKSSFISGHSMVRLEPSDYSFLWGLSCLTLFQGQQLLSAKHARPILSSLKSIYDCDSDVKETHGVTSTEIALLVFQSLSQERFFHPDFLTLDLCKELLQFLVYANPSDDSWNRLVVGLLSQIVQFCPNAYFEVEDFTGAALELFFKCLSAVHSNMFPEDEASFTGLFSQLFIMAEGLVGKMNHKKNQQRMVTTLISMTSKWFRGASSKLCLSKVLACLHDLMQFLRGNIKDETGCVINDHTHVKTVILNWSSMLAFISQDCSKRIHILDNKMDDLGKLLGKILSLCLEEAVALAKLIYQTQTRDNVDSYQQMLLSVLRVCIRCIQDALCDSDRQVQTAGLNLLKLVAQRELAEPLNIKGHHFFLFLGSELLGDIYSLIQHELKEPITKESISLIEESLGLLFLFHTLAQKIEQTPAILKLLLEALVMVFTISNETHSQGFQDVNAIARRVMGHLIHSPSSASQLKDVMLSMPVFRRQQLQDMIRASVSQDQMMASKLNQQSEIQERLDNPPPELGGAVVAETPENEYHDASQENDEEDDEDDWEAFQSLPAEAPTPSFDTHDERRDSEIASVSYPSDVENDVDKFAGNSKWPEFPGNPADTEGTWSREIRKPEAKEESIDLIYPEYHEGSGFVIDASEIFHHFQSDEDFREIENKWVSKMMKIL